jgi:hypothetical protein
MNGRYKRGASAAVLMSVVLVLPTLGCTGDEGPRSSEWQEHVARLDAHSSAELAGIARGPDRQEAAYAEWLLGLRLAHEDRPRSRLHIARAALLLGSSQPILEYGRSFLFDDDLRDQALPYLLLARELGGEWVEARLSSYGEEQKARGAAELEAIKEEIRRLEEEP